MVIDNSQKTEGGVLHSELDEGWWSSVLQDEVLLEKVDQRIGNSPEKQESNSVDVWDRILSIYHQDEIVVLRVHSFNRGGLLVQGAGIHGFVPVSHIIGAPEHLDNEEKRRQFLSKYIGISLRLKVIECEPKEERVVFSERAAKAGEGIRKQLLVGMKPGDRITGNVTNITDFGVFIDLGGVEGLIHVSELSWGRVQHPSDILRVGQKIQALVLSVSEESSRVALSLKQLDENPWGTLGNSLGVGDVIPVTVSAIMRYGVFVRLEQGIEGLIHITSIRMPPGVRDIRRHLRVGQSIYARVLHLDVDRRRLGLSLETS